MHGLGLKCQECSQIGRLKKKRLANETNQKLLNELSIEKTYLVTFLGHTDATGTTKNVVKVTQVFLQC